MRIVIVIALLGLVAVSVYAAEPEVVIEDLLRTAPLPKGFSTKSQDIIQDNKVYGKAVFVVSDERIAAKRISGVNVLIENYQRPTRPHKVAGFKGYVNSAYRHWLDQGYREVTNVKPPDVETLDFDQRIHIRFKFQKEDKTMEVENQIFFTDVGYNVSVTSDSPDDFKMLSEWAKTVRPK